MKVTLCKNRLGLVLNAPQALGKFGSIVPLSAYLILNQYSVDEGGNIGLTGATAIRSTFDDVDALKAELDDLLDSAVSWIERSVHSRCTADTAGSNDNQDCLGGVIMWGRSDEMREPRSSTLQGRESDS